MKRSRVCHDKVSRVEPFISVNVFVCGLHVFMFSILSMQVVLHKNLKYVLVLW